jgi:hypothetical protein
MTEVTVTLIVKETGASAALLQSGTPDEISIRRYIGYDGMRLTSQNCSLYRPLLHPRVMVMWTVV